MPVRCVAFDPDVLTDPREVLAVLEQVGEDRVLALLADRRTSLDRSRVAHRFDLRLAADDLRRALPDPLLLSVTATAAGCRPHELVVVGERPELLAAAGAAGSAAIGLRSAPVGAPAPTGSEPQAAIARLADLPAAIDRLDADERAAAGEVGVGPHPTPWPDDPRLDPALLADGDRRNVVDRYRYWREEAIVADLDARRVPVHVAVENWRHDLNIGTVVRNANAFNVAGVHIVGRRRWNRRGAMATDRYLHVRHHAGPAELASWASDRGLALVGIDNRPGAVPIEATALPADAVLVFGQEGPGLSAEMAAACSMVCEITQLGSTRSLNAGVASGIALHVWLGQHWLRSRPVP
jgi:tRNA(Leu) C34 or U34 (ribose-2'-O)-methylase TrmL